MRSFRNRLKLPLPSDSETRGTRLATEHEQQGREGRGRGGRSLKDADLGTKRKKRGWLMVDLEGLR